MLDFTPVRDKEITFDELVKGLTIEDLAKLTNEMVDRQLALIADCVNEDVTFVPQDPDAHDSAAVTEEEVGMAWTLGHIIVHTTSSSEEAAFMAAELARGVPYEKRRSRYEVHWTTMKTIDQCRRRLEESRRMRLASLNMWPDPPHLDNLFVSYFGGEYNAIVRFVLGLSHDDSHLEQITEVVRQAKAARQ
jgi:hypothetical protein